MRAEQFDAVVGCHKTSTATLDGEVYVASQQGERRLRGKTQFAMNELKTNRRGQFGASGARYHYFLVR
ncbi:protein of unknown function [Paraburkholderia dioscoreae]|uniref:Uncharacterized protein n=1 Tax=Paraburkholderia dioscoreae TaxID=2604047 RepID=A0A5Q4Z1S3_9BURK|nr:protein of unknown function [Paraburkholderia dioscoreae]